MPGEKLSISTPRSLISGANSGGSAIRSDFQSAGASSRGSSARAIAAAMAMMQTDNKTRVMENSLLAGQRHTTDKSNKAKVNQRHGKETHTLARHVFLCGLRASVVPL